MNMVPTVLEATAAAALANAWAAYYQGASVSGVPVGNIASAKSAFQSALTGMSAPNAFAAKATAAVNAFWGVIVPAGATLWIVPGFTTILITPPPSIASITAALLTLFANNSVNPAVTLAQAANDIATILHTSGGLGGIATLQPIAPGPNVLVPIL